LPKTLRSAAPLLGARALSRRIILLSIAAAYFTLQPLNAANASSDVCSAPEVSIPAFGGLDRTVERLKSRTAVRILALGSSSTQGVGASSPAAAYPAQLELALTRRFPGQEIVVVNAGIAGETADLTLARLDRELENSKPDLVLWQVGTNDALTAAITEKEFASAVERGVASIKRHRRDIVIIDQQFFKKAENPARYERFVAILERVAKERGLVLFSRFRTMKFWETSIAGGIEAMLTKDGFHMNDRGYACVARLLADHILGVASASPQ
jgi:acyl-CoA thioesterase-1